MRTLPVLLVSYESFNIAAVVSFSLPTVWQLFKTKISPEVIMNN
jgi:hypothetical protein